MIKLTTLLDEIQVTPPPGLRQQLYNKLEECSNIAGKLKIKFPEQAWGAFEQRIDDIIYSLDDPEFQLDEIQIKQPPNLKEKLARKIVDTLDSQRFDTWYKEEFDDLITTDLKIKETIRIFNL